MNARQRRKRYRAIARWWDGKGRHPNKDYPPSPPFVFGVLTGGIPKASFYRAEKENEGEKRQQ
jgi:hypothetical protein